MWKIWKYDVKKEWKHQKNMKISLQNGVQKRTSVPSHLNCFYQHNHRWKKRSFSILFLSINPPTITYQPIYQSTNNLLLYQPPISISHFILNLSINLNHSYFSHNLNLSTSIWQPTQSLSYFSHLMRGSNDHPTNL